MKKTTLSNLILRKAKLPKLWQIKQLQTSLLIKVISTIFPLFPKRSLQLAVLKLCSTDHVNVHQLNVAGLASIEVANVLSQLRSKDTTWNVHTQTTCLLTTGVVWGIPIQRVPKCTEPFKGENFGIITYPSCAQFVRFLTIIVYSFLKSDFLWSKSVGSKE